MNDNILFYDIDAVCKYNVDKNGLYLNDEIGLKEYSTPYYGVTYNPITKLYVPIPHVKKELVIKLQEHSQIQQCIRKGLNFKKLQDSWPIAMPGVKDIRDAAYIAQLYRFSDNNFDLIVCYYLHRYIEKDPEIEKLFSGVNDWLYEPVTRTYDPKDDKYKISQHIIDKAKRDKIKKKEELQKALLKLNNEKSLIERMSAYAKQKGYIIDKIDYNTAKQLLAIKMREEQQKEQLHQQKLDDIVNQKINEKLERSRIILHNIIEQEKMLKTA